MLCFDDWKSGDRNNPLKNEVTWLLFGHQGNTHANIMKTRFNKIKSAGLSVSHLHVADMRNGSAIPEMSMRYRCAKWFSCTINETCTCALCTYVVHCFNVVFLRHAFVYTDNVATFLPV